MAEIKISNLILAPFLIEEVSIISDKVRALPPLDRDRYALDLQVPDLLTIANAFVLGKDVTVEIK